MHRNVAILYMNLGPYHVARLEALAKLSPNLLAIEIAAQHDMYPWEPKKGDPPFTLVTLFDSSAEKVSIREQKRAVIRCLEKYNPSTVIISVYSDLVMRIAASWARKRLKKGILLFSSTEMARPRVWWREWVKSRYVRKFQALAVTGQKAAQYAQKLGVPQNKIFVIGNAVDNEECHNRAETYRAGYTEVRDKLRLPRDFFLYVGRMSREKNLPMLLEAYFTYRKSGGTWDLVLVGSGPEIEKLRQIASPLNGSIHFAGWKQFEELIAYYALAKCFVLPSIFETWGLVVNEAMACGLPILVSSNCGCTADLCKNDINGHIFDPYDGDSLASLMANYSNGKYDLRKMGVESKTIIRQYTPDSWAHGLLKTIAP